jgi:hypothetical protein
LDVLYGEADPETLRRVQEHLGLCASCRDEMKALGQLRQVLASWKQPPRPRDLRAVRQRWAFLAAAALLLLGLGGALGLSGSEMAYENGAFRFRLGRTDTDVPRLLQEQEARHRREMRSLEASLKGTPVLDEQALLAQVGQMIHASEGRQTQLLETRFADFNERTEARRRYDLARISAGLSYLDVKSGQHVARATQLMGYVLKASQEK